MSLVSAALPFALLAQSGRADLIDEFVAPFSRDRQARLIGCWAITEPLHGSDQFLYRAESFFETTRFGALKAYREGDYYVINGGKAAWVTNAAIATHALVCLTLFSDTAVAGKAIAIVPLNLQGIARGAPVDMMGQRALAQCALNFAGVTIPERYLLVDSSGYEARLEQGIALLHGALAAVMSGVARAALEVALDHVREQRRAGKDLFEHELVQKRLFDLYMGAQAASAVSRRAMIDERYSVEAAIAAKVFCTTTAFKATDSALALAGAQGLARAHLASKLFRDSRAALTEAGANDVLALMAAQRLWRGDEPVSGG